MDRSTGDGTSPPLIRNPRGYVRLDSVLFQVVPTRSLLTRIDSCPHLKKSKFRRSLLLLLNHANSSGNKWEGLWVNRDHQWNRGVGSSVVVQTLMMRAPAQPYQVALLSLAASNR